MKILMYAFLVFFFGVFPLAACLFFDRYKRHFHGSRVLIPILLYTLFSWGMVNGVVLLKISLDPKSFRGPEGGFALFFGWLYLWITSIPVFLLYAVVRIVFCRTKKECRNQPD